VNLVLSATDELDDREASREHAPDHAVDLLLHQVKHVLIAHREAEQELAPIEVMDDVHRLQDRARAGLPMALSGGHQQQVLHARRLDGLRNREIELPA